MKGEPFLEIDISENTDARERLKSKGFKTVPQIFYPDGDILVTITLWREDMYEYKCKIRKVVDGDTVDVDIDLGFGVWLRKQRVRLLVLIHQSHEQKIYKKRSMDCAKSFSQSG